MKAIAKYLPVKGEIKEKIRVGSTNGRLVSAVVHKIVKGIAHCGNKVHSGWHYSIKDLFPVKLFAVTFNIKTGDKVQCKDSIESIIIDGKVNTIKMLKEDTWFKVLGELSPNAIWVEDGDKIEVAQGAIHTETCVLIRREIGEENHMSEMTKDVDYLIVKCLTCNTYH